VSRFNIVMLSVIIIEIRLESDACKNISSFESKILAVYGPNLGFDTEQRNSFLIKFGGFWN
jgi:hypothetical protein